MPPSWHQAGCCCGDPCTDRGEAQTGTLSVVDDVDWGGHWCEMQDVDWTFDTFSDAETYCTWYWNGDLYSEGFSIRFSKTTEKYEAWLNEEGGGRVAFHLTDIPKSDVTCTGGQLSFSLTLLGEVDGNCETYGWTADVSL